MCLLPTEEQLNIGLISEDFLTAKIDIASLRVVSCSLVIWFSSQNWNETRAPCSYGLRWACWRSPPWSM